MHILIENLKTHANAVDIDSAKATLTEMTSTIPGDEVLISEIIQPAVSSGLFTLLIEKFGVEERVMQSHQRAPREVTRALRIVRTLTIGLSRVR